MKLKSPTTLTFWVSVVLAVLGLLGALSVLPFLSAYAFWLALVAFIVLAAGVMFKGM